MKRLYHTRSSAKLLLAADVRRNAPFSTAHMVQIREAKKSEIEQIIEFYKQCGYNGGAKNDDFILIATEDNSIIGAVRICLENNTFVLRGMQIKKEFQQQGIGTKLLSQLNKVFVEKECYCLPYAHLETFYNQIGFKKIKYSDAPPFLNERLTHYNKVHSTPIILMKKGQIA